MTDFVVSRVAMSVCALLVAGSMAGMVDTSLKPDPGEYLEQVLECLQETVAILASGGAEAALSWTVPSLPSGASVLMSFACGSVLARSDGLTKAADTGLRTWIWDRSPLNATVIQALDSSGPTLDVWTGQAVMVSVLRVLVDDSSGLMLFVTRASVLPAPEALG